GGGKQSEVAFGDRVHIPDDQIERNTVMARHPQPAVGSDMQCVLAHCQRAVNRRAIVDFAVGEDQGLPGHSLRSIIETGSKQSAKYSATGANAEDQRVRLRQRSLISRRLTSGASRKSFSRLA